MSPVFKNSLRSILLSAMVLSLTALSNQASGQNLYSRQSNNWNAVLTWFTDAARTVPFVGIPGAGHTLNIGNGHVITFQSGSVATLAGIIVNDNATSGTFTVGNNATVGTVLTITGDVTVNTSGIFQSGATGATGHSILFAGNLINNNVFNLNANGATNQSIQFNGSGPRTISGTGSYTFNHVTVNTGASNNINVNSSILINRTLFFAANGLLILGSTSDITLASTSNITSSNASRYIQVDGTTSANSQLIRVNSGIVGDWQFLFPIGTVSGGYSPVDL